MQSGSAVQCGFIAERKLDREPMYCIVDVDILAPFLIKKPNRFRSHLLGKLAWPLKSKVILIPVNATLCSGNEVLCKYLRALCPGRPIARHTCYHPDPHSGPYFFFSFDAPFALAVPRTVFARFLRCLPVVVFHQRSSQLLLSDQVT